MRLKYRMDEAYLVIGLNIKTKQQQIQTILKWKRNENRDEMYKKDVKFY